MSLLRTVNLLTGNLKCVISCNMEFAGEEFALLPATRGVPPARDRNKAKDPKVRNNATALHAQRYCTAGLAAGVAAGLSCRTVEMYLQPWRCGCACSVCMQPCLVLINPV
jgi:hypothetical protein